ncbi:hypothetical protein KSP40_PGU019213 [Platanthera guangdongensis]|uniref:Transmembrane protein n=1 Tax=Platanthera guangdongensis TaxID=2320717 RepID=A0ABR2M9G5_9ASPA
MAPDTTDPSYWLNWRFLLCATWVLSSMAAAFILLWRYENFELNGNERRKAQFGKMGILSEEEFWMPCLKTIHPGWLLVFRVIAFFMCAVLIIVDIILKGASQLYFYTQWTFLLVTIYFGLGSLLSIYGCHQYAEVTDDKIDYLVLDAESRPYVTPKDCESANGSPIAKNPGSNEYLNIQKITRLGGHLFQIIYQTNAGAVMLTDFTFWFIIFPFLTSVDFDLDFLQIGMHSLNAVFLICDTALNSLQFPWFRIAYFILWTSFFVIFQWVLHACISLWWPYPFLDLSSARSPIWYLAVAVMHVPCYAFFPLIMKIKHCLILRWFPDSYYLSN